MGNEAAGKPKALIWEPQDDVRQYIEKILTLAGWETFGSKTAAGIPQILKKDLFHPFALFICNYEQSMEQNHNLLKKVKTISPVTQRLILVPEAHSHSLTQVVNKIGIRACITIPCPPKVLVGQVRSCLRYFSNISKRMRMKRIISHQNQQLYRAAKKMGEKETALTRLIEGKKSQKEMLARVDVQGKCTLKERISYHNIPMTPEDLEAERAGLENEVIRLFEQAAREAGLQMPREKKRLACDGEPKDSALTETAEKILQTVLGSVPAFRVRCRDENDAGMTAEGMENACEPSTLDPFFHVRISKDRLMGFIEKSEQIRTMEEGISLPQVLEFLKIKGISHGIVSDKVLDSWLKNASPHEPLQVAQGTPPFPGKDGKVTYYFENMSIVAGRIQEDGSMDFTERAHIPHVCEGDLLAEKSPALQGTPGITVGGDTIEVPVPLDPGFGIKLNACFSEDGLSIFSSINGQPHVDALGNVSVNPEMVIQGDVGYETGNIDFAGNVVVKGSIREGFSVKCVNLAVEDIQGAYIAITGDLTVGAGITESNVSAVGPVQAKFVNKSFVSTFSDITVQKEILDSEILLGGACINSAGHIIASRIVARGGLEAGRIGTDSSPPCVICVGRNDLAKKMKSQIAKQMKKIQIQYQSAERSIEEMMAKDQELYPVIIRKANDQESIVSLLNRAQKKRAGESVSKDMKPSSYLEQEVARLDRKKASVEKELDELFRLQDSYLKSIDDLQESCRRLKDRESRLMNRFQEIAQFEKNTPAVPEVIINRTVTRKTAVHGMDSFLIVGREQASCRIREVRKKENHKDGIQPSMVITDL